MLHEINKASDAIRKKYKLLQEQEQFVFLTNCIASLVDFMKHTFILRLTRSLHDGGCDLFRSHSNTNFY